MPDQKTMWTRCLGGFSVMWVTKLLISQVKKRIFCPKMTKFGPKLAFWSIWARPCRLIWCPVGGSVGGCGVRAVSRKKPIYFILFGPVAKITKKFQITVPLVSKSKHWFNPKHNAGSGHTWQRTQIRYISQSHACVSCGGHKKMVCYILSFSSNPCCETHQ